MAGSEKIFIDGPAGSLECLWLPSGSDPLDRALVLCHPHPLYGGTMETKLVARAAKKLSESGFQTLRFNFRGVGRSEGSWAEGAGERDDLRAVLDYIRSRLPESRLAVFGFSFGAWVGLDVGNSRPDVEALVGVAPPVGRVSFDFLRDSTKPKLIVYAGRDAIVDPEGLVEWASGLREPKEVVGVPEADHLFKGQVDEVAEMVARFLVETLSC